MLHSTPTFDQLELTRGVLALLSYEGDINSQRIKNFLANIGMPSEVQRETLRDLKSLKELEGLGYGYWIPTPTRIVPINDRLSILISISPTAELKRHFPSISRAGLGRLVETSETYDLPVQSILSWRGIYEVDNAKHTLSFIRDNKDRLRPSTLPSHIEGFSINEKSLQHYGSSYAPIWLPHNDPEILAFEGVSLFRTKVTKRFYRYFLARFRGADAFFEGIEIQDYRNFQYGFSALLGKSLSVLVKHFGSTTVITFPLLPPASINQLLICLCEKNLDRFGFVWTCYSIECWEVISSALTTLGCEILKHD